MLERVLILKSVGKGLNTLRCVGKSGNTEVYWEGCEHFEVCWKVCVWKGGNTEVYWEGCEHFEVCWKVCVWKGGNTEVCWEGWEY